VVPSLPAAPRCSTTDMTSSRSSSRSSTQGAAGVGRGAEIEVCPPLMLQPAAARVGPCRCSWKRDRTLLLLTVTAAAAAVDLCRSCRSWLQCTGGAAVVQPVLAGVSLLRCDLVTCTAHEVYGLAGATVVFFSCVVMFL
jgi:hypothetical protein